ncbi:MAG: sodium/hydrogen exchanger [Anaerocolumna sp.]|nr:sodium/hydrogen exchanger [Anaerocolumna sp.]
MNSEDFVKFALQIIVMLSISLMFGQIMRRLKQPTILGELIGGIILGVTIFGALFPGAYSWLFQSSENVVVARDAFIKMGMLFFMFTIGLEINISDLRDMGRNALIIGIIGTLLPIVAGIGLVYLIPKEFWGPLVQKHFFIFALFIGINLANSANPVIARILMDIGYLKDKIGTIIMAATVVDDVINWFLFALILNVITPEQSAINFDFSIKIVLTIAFFIVTLLGRNFIYKALDWVRNRVVWPNGFIALTACIILVFSSLTEFIGIHAFLGAFLVGIAVAGSSKEAYKAFKVIKCFSHGFFAPIYFVSIGMATNFAHNFDLLLVIFLIVIACVTKFGSVLIGARLSGLKINRQVIAIASGLNARGATGIILAGVGLANGLIDDRIFVAIFIMALVTSFMSGTMMNFFLTGNFRVKEITQGVNKEQVTSDLNLVEEEIAVASEVTED